MLKYRENPKLYKGALTLVLAVMWYYCGRLLVRTHPGLARTDVFDAGYLFFLLWFCGLIAFGLFGLIYTLQGIKIFLKDRRAA
jgi:hypothetical protein